MARWLVLNEDGRVHEALNLDMVDHIDFAYHARDPERLAEVTLYIRGRKPLHLSDDEHMRFVLDYVTAVPAAPDVAMPAAPQPAPPLVEAPAVAAAPPAEQAPPAAPRKPRTTRRTAAAEPAPAQSEPADVPAAEPRPKPRATRRRNTTAEPA